MESNINEIESKVNSKYKTKDSDENNLVCDICQKICKREQGLKIHKKTHDVIPQCDGMDDTSEVDMQENSDAVITSIEFTPDCQADWSDKVVFDIIAKRVKAAGLHLTDLKIIRNDRKAFTSCLAAISPIPSTSCGELIFSFGSKWTWKFG